MGVGSERHSGHSTRGKYPVAVTHEAGWAPGPDWKGAENLATHRGSKHETMYT